MKYTHHLLFAAGSVLAVATPSSVRAAGEDDQTVYTGVVEKFINTYCIKCHTTEKHKGKLVMESYESLMKGGESAKDGKPAVKAGKSAESLMITALGLPKDDDAHMPPEEKPQPNAKEIAVIKWWIDSGAKSDVKIKDANVPADVKATVMELAAKKVEKPAAK